MSYVGCVVKSITGLKELSFDEIRRSSQLRTLKYVNFHISKNCHLFLALVERVCMNDYNYKKSFSLSKKKKEKRNILSEHHLTNHLITEGDLNHSYVY